MAEEVEAVAAALESGLLSWLLLLSWLGSCGGCAVGVDMVASERVNGRRESRGERRRVSFRDERVSTLQKSKQVKKELSVVETGLKQLEHSIVPR